MSNAISVDRWITDFRLKLDALDNSFIMYAMKQHGLKRITTNQVNIVKACYMVHKDGLSITTNILSAVTGKGPVNLLATMHGLGDKRIIYLLGNDMQKLVWEMAPHFCNLLDEVLKDV